MESFDPFKCSANLLPLELKPEKRD
jgi:hypothetical protein